VKKKVVKKAECKKCKQARKTRDFANKRKGVRLKKVSDDLSDIEDLL